MKTRTTQGDSGKNNCLPDLLMQLIGQHYLWIFLLLGGKNSLPHARYLRAVELIPEMHLAIYGCPLLHVGAVRMQCWTNHSVAFVFSASSNIRYTCKGYLKMFDIPPGARHVLVQEDEASPHVLGKCFCLPALLFLVHKHKMSKTLHMGVCMCQIHIIYTGMRIIYKFISWILGLNFTFLQAILSLEQIFKTETSVFGRKGIGS